MPGRITRSVRAALTRGAISGIGTVDNSTIELNGSQARVKDAGITLAKLAATAAPIKHVVGAGIFTTAGGDANESITITGLVGTDTVLVWVQKAGGTPRTVDTITPGTGSCAVVLSGDPSTDHKLGWVAIRAAA